MSQQWIITRTTGRAGLYVTATKGARNAYTNRMANARRFNTYEQAALECCGNEIPIRLPLRLLK